MSGEMGGAESDVLTDERRRKVELGQGVRLRTLSLKHLAASVKERKIQTHANT